MSDRNENKYPDGTFNFMTVMALWVIIPVVYLVIAIILFKPLVICASICLGIGVFAAAWGIHTRRFVLGTAILWLTALVTFIWMCCL